MKALITGGGGFVGLYLGAHLADAGDEVVSIDRTGPEGLDITDRDAIRDALRASSPRTSSTTSRHSRTSASRGTTPPACSA